MYALLSIIIPQVYTPMYVSFDRDTISFGHNEIRTKFSVQTYFRTVSHVSLIYLLHQKYCRARSKGDNSVSLSLNGSVQFKKFCSTCNIPQNLSLSE